MNMLPTSFLDAQPNVAYRDALNFLTGVIAIHPDSQWHLEEHAGVQAAKKVNFKIGGLTVIAISLLASQFRLEVRDKERVIAGLEERGQQAEVKGYRNLVFRPDDPAALARAVEVLRQYLVHYHEEFAK